MAVAMASCALGAHLSNAILKASETRVSSGCFIRGAKCFSIFHQRKWLSSAATITPRASTSTVEDASQSESDTDPTPVVIIDQDSDPDATIVEITFGDRLGALLDTMNALKNLGLNVVKANVFLDSSGKHNKFAITKADTGRKVDDPELLEAIRLTIINNLIEYHPESSAQLAMGAAFGIVPPKQQVDVDIATHIRINDDGPNRSLLSVETADRPGLLVDLVKIITDINIAVQSGEFDTEGLLAKAKFHVSYRDKPISKPLQLVLANSLRYFLRRPFTEEVDVDIATHIRINDDGPNRSLLSVETADRLGLLVDLVKIITDINIAVQSGEFDTEGLLAKAKFHVSYRDKPISKPLQLVLANSLRYFLRRPFTEEASF